MEQLLLTQRKQKDIQEGHGILVYYMVQSIDVPNFKIKFMLKRDNTK